MPLNNTTTWISTSPADVKVGMEVKIVEKYPSGATFAAEGTVKRVFCGDDGLRRCELVGVPPVERPTPPDGFEVEIYRRPKKLPLAIGSAIKVYDSKLLRERVAICRVRPGVETNSETGWFFVDGTTMDGHAFLREVPEHLTDSAEVLFDAGKA